MIKNPKKMAEDLIKQGKKNKDDSLIQLGMSILDSLKTEPQDIITTIKRNDVLIDRNVYDDNGNIIGKKTRKEEFKKTKRSNLFVDDGSIRSEDGDEKKQNMVRAPRTRQPYKPVTAKCNTCGSVETVTHGHSTYYKCAKCARKEMRM